MDLKKPLISGTLLLYLDGCSLVKPFVKPPVVETNLAFPEAACKKYKDLEEAVVMGKREDGSIYAQFHCENGKPVGEQVVMFDKEFKNINYHNKEGKSEKSLTFDESGEIMSRGGNVYEGDKTTSYTISFFSKDYSGPLEEVKGLLNKWKFTEPVLVYKGKPLKDIKTLYETSINMGIAPDKVAAPILTSAKDPEELLRDISEIITIIYGKVPQEIEEQLAKKEEKIGKKMEDVLKKVIEVYGKNEINKKYGKDHSLPDKVEIKIFYNSKYRR